MVDAAQVSRSIAQWLTYSSHPHGCCIFLVRDIQPLKKKKKELRSAYGGVQPAYASQSLGTGNAKLTA